MALTYKELEEALLGVDPTTAETLLQFIEDPSFNGQFTGLNLQKAEQLLPLAKAFSYHPISGLSVGAVALARSGNFYIGANFELLDVPLHATIHAEQSALLNAWIHNEKEVQALYITELPCGHCRQFLQELSNIEEVQIFVRGRTYSHKSLLPHYFGNSPPIGQGLLDSVVVSLESTHPQLDVSVQEAIQSAECSYVPYSNCQEGFSIECEDGKIFSGRAAECAAFNPSVPSVMAAINQRNLSSSRNISICKATQARLVKAINNPLPFSRNVISSLSSCEVQEVEVKIK